MTTTNINAEVITFFKIKSLGKFVKNFVGLSITIAAILTLIFLIWGGIEYIISGGNQDRAKSAKSKITNGITGFIIVVIIWAIWRLIIYFLGVADTPEGTTELKLPFFY